MSDKPAAKETPNSPNETQSQFFKDAYNFSADTIAHPQSRMRQMSVVVTGALIGGAKDAPNEINNHPLETAKKVAVTLAAGAGATALLSTGSPWIVGGTVLGGGFLLGCELKNSLDKAFNNIELSKALAAAWKSGDAATMSKSRETAEKQLGPEAFDYGLAAISGGVGAKFAPSIITKIASRFASKSVWNFHVDSEWIKQPDGTRVKFDHNDLYRETSTLYPDGTVKKVLGDGYAETFYPNGKVIREHPNGIKDIGKLSGGTCITEEVHYPDGKKITISPTGNRVTLMPNGTSIWQSPDGYVVIEKTDGSKYIKMLSGSFRYHYPNGDTLSGNCMGKKILHTSADDLFEIKPNGKKIPIDRDGVPIK